METKVLMFLGLLLLSFIFLVAAVASPISIIPSPAKLLFLLFSMVFDLLAFASRYYSQYIFEILKQHRREVVLSEENAYKLSETGEAVIARKGEAYIATIYMSIPLYVSGSEMPAEERLEFGKQMGRLISINKEPVRYTTQMRVLNKDSYIEEIHDLITSSENEVVKLLGSKGPEGEIARLKGRIEMWSNILNSIGATQSLELVTYATVSASGANELEATSAVQQKARDLMSGISATLGVIPLLAVGNELIRLIEPEHSVPFTTVTEQITKRIEEEVI